jgi:hypothetical protein
MHALCSGWVDQLSELKSKGIELHFTQESGYGFWASENLRFKEKSWIGIDGFGIFLCDSNDPKLKSYSETTDTLYNDGNAVFVLVGPLAFCNHDCSSVIILKRNQKRALSNWFPLKKERDIPTWISAYCRFDTKIPIKSQILVNYGCDCGDGKSKCRFKF